MTPFARWWRSQREPKAANAPEATAGTMLPLGEGVPLTEEEARGVVDLIRPCLMEYVSERKYPPKIYEDLLRAVRVPDNITD
jgi:hypothetical protein